VPLPPVSPLRSDSLFTANRATRARQGLGGAAYLAHPRFTLATSQLSANSAHYGGAFFLATDLGQAATLASLALSGNKAAGAGPAGYWWEQSRGRGSWAATRRLHATHQRGTARNTSTAVPSCCCVPSPRSVVLCVRCVAQSPPTLLSPVAAVCAAGCAASRRQPTSLVKRAWCSRASPPLPQRHCRCGSVSAAAPLDRRPRTGALDQQADPSLQQRCLPQAAQTCPEFPAGGQGAPAQVQTNRNFPPFEVQLRDFYGTVAATAQGMCSVSGEAAQIATPPDVEDGEPLHPGGRATCRMRLGAC
jgi:hypothetical protein